MTIFVLAPLNGWVYENRMRRKRDPQRTTIEWIVKGLEKPGKTTTGLANALGLPQPRVSEMKRGARLLKVTELSKAAAYLEEPVPSELIETADAPGGTQSVPHLSWISAGLMRREDISDEQIGMLYTSGLPSGDWIALTVQGDSMDRISPPESIIFVNRRDKKLVPNGLYVIADADGNATYKRYRTGPPPRFEAVSTRADIEPIYPEQEPTIIGRVRRTILDM